MRRSSFFFLLILLAAGDAAARAQAVAAAAGERQFSITAGGIASAFQPDFVYNSWNCLQQCQNFSNWFLFSEASHQPSFGEGAYVDFKFSRWVQVEAEGRWLHFHQYGGVAQGNYLIGPKVSVLQARRTTVYAKALGGYSNMNFGVNQGYGQYTTLAFGGGLDWKVTRRLSIRALDFEYQYWPSWAQNSTLSPYGASMGIGYRIF